MTTAPPSHGPWIHGRHFLPLGLAYIAGALEKAGFQVEIFDNYLLEKPIDEVKLEVKQLNPEIVGITCGSATYRQCIETAKAVKEVLPSCKVIVGGWHPSYEPDSMLQHPEIDYVVIGEGERAMVELATSLSKGEGDQGAAAIAGVAFRRGGKVVKTPPKFINNLDEIPFPARHLLPMHLYERKIEYLDVQPVDNMSIMRGCPFNCAFCEISHLWGKTCRSFSPSRVVQEIEHLKTNFGTRGIYFINDNFTVKKNLTLELCALMKKNRLDIEWACDTRVDLVSREMLREMKAAGCKTIWFGGESGSPRILEKLNKGVTLEQIEHAFKIAREEGIQTACSFMMGIPGETVADMEATFRFARKLDPDWCRFNIFVAVPGSSLYQEVIQKHLYSRLEDFVAYVRTEDFDYDSLLAIQRRFHRNFNRSPKRILRKIRREGFFTVLKKSPAYFSG
ncbi:MAG: B12-binding domain-containing radical SAM protein [Candidatus Bathyarchaeota archaeon]|nr:B12-binding domain-containing radical SAM protein [Candidatus Bathyarchaeota archaeon]